MSDAVAFRADWEANGPTVPGLDPMDATDRLRKFQQLFEVGRGQGSGCCWAVGCWEALEGRSAPNHAAMQLLPHSCAGLWMLVIQRSAEWA